MKQDPRAAAFPESRVAVIRKEAFSKPVLVVGLPGIGLVSKLAIDNVVKASKAKPFGVIYSKHFPNQVIAMPSGKLKLFGLYLYKVKLGKNDAIIVRGDLQPLTVEGQYEVSSRLLEYFKSQGGSTVLSMAGYAINRVTDAPKIYASTTSSKLLAQLKKAGAVPSGSAVPIVGMAGLVPGMARLYGMQGACVLVETPGPVVDAKGAIAISNLLNRMFGAKIDTKPLDGRAAKAAKMLEQFQQQATKQEAAQTPVVPTKRDELSYIR